MRKWLVTSDGTSKVAQYPPVRDLLVFAQPEIAQKFLCCGKQLLYTPMRHSITVSMRTCVVCSSRKPFCWRRSNPSPSDGSWPRLRRAFFAKVLCVSDRAPAGEI
mmetsp:Transcript_10467/g.31983  ORF Transcript_10467/g.31983 Transcript_10467/m.31983 type:complete len:105 (-) Transcript_10467:192-506(-)